MSLSESEAGVHCDFVEAISPILCKLSKEVGKGRRGWITEELVVLIYVWLTRSLV